MEVKRVSLIIPCYNEGATVEEFFKRAKALADSQPAYHFEFIFVNDCSTDKTGMLLNALADRHPEVSVLHFAQNRGHQIALTAGLDHASGDIMVTIDADLQDPPEIISQMLVKIQEGFDIVHAQRQVRKGESGFKLFTSWLFYRLMRWFSDTRIIQNCGDFRAFNRPVREAMAEFRMPHRFLRGTFVQLGFRQCVIKYDREARHAGRTKYSLLKMIRLSIDAMLGFSAVPVRIISCLSILLWVISLIYLIRALFQHFILNLTVPGWTSIIALMFFFTGLILFSIAIIGSYVGRIFVQGQNIPLYWLSDARNVDFEDLDERTGDLREVRLSRRIIQRRGKRSE